MASKWKSSQRRSEVRARQSSRQFSSQSFDLIDGFSEMDKSGKHVLTIAEIVSLMETKGFSSEYAKTYWNYSEDTKDNEVTFEDYKSKVTRSPVSILESEFARLRRIFDRFDEKNTGNIEKKDIPNFIAQTEAVSRIFRPDIKKTMAAVDKTSENFVPYQDIDAHLRAKKCQYTSTEEEILEHAFKSFDKDNDGELSLSEIVDMMERRGYPSIFARVFLDAIDADGDFTIKFEEFKYKLQACPISAADSGLAELQRLFNLFDKDGNGYIEASDLQQYIEEAEETSRYFGQAIKGAITAIDVNKDGRISFDELSQFLKKQVPTAPSEEEEYLESKFQEIIKDDDERVDMKRVQQMLLDEGYQQILTKRFLNLEELRDPKTMSKGEFSARLREYRIPMEDACAAHLNRAFKQLDKQEKGMVQQDDVNVYLKTPDCAEWFKSALMSVLNNMNNTSRSGMLSYRELTEGLRFAAQRPLF